MRFFSDQTTRNIARHILQGRKQSPHILFAAGLVGIITSTVLACRATLKLGEVLEDFQEDLNELEKFKTGDAVELVNHPSGSIQITQYERDHHNRYLIDIYAQGSFSILRLYAPTIIIGVLSIGALTKSHVMLSSRNASLTAAFAGLTKAYDEYRGRVKEEVGEEKELDLYHGVCMETVFDDDGNPLMEIKVVDPSKLSIYSRFFDEGSPYWQKDTEYNQMFLVRQMNVANQLLQKRGYVFLNEIYERLGIEPTLPGELVGWLLDKGGDNYIDFGIYEARNKQFVDGWEPRILLDFNVDGQIFDRIRRKKRA